MKKPFTIDAICDIAVACEVVARMQRTPGKMRRAAKMLRAFAAMTEDVQRAMAVLNPSMPESGIADAARQVKQVAITSMGNVETLERIVGQQRAEIRRLKGQRPQ